MMENWIARKEAGTWYVDADRKQSFFDVCEVFGFGILAESRAHKIAAMPEMEAALKATFPYIECQCYPRSEYEGECLGCGYEIVREKAQQALAKGNCREGLDESLPQGRGYRRGKGNCREGLDEVV